MVHLKLWLHVLIISIVVVDGEFKLTNRSIGQKLIIKFYLIMCWSLFVSASMYNMYFEAQAILNVIVKLKQLELQQRRIFIVYMFIIQDLKPTNLLI